jgi:hypothetical protein
VIDTPMLHLMALIVFLATADASCLNAAAVPVDGGTAT